MPGTRFACHLLDPAGLQLLKCASCSWPQLWSLPGVHELQGQASGVHAEQGSCLQGAALPCRT